MKENIYATNAVMRSNLIKMRSIFLLSALIFGTLALVLLGFAFVQDQMPDSRLQFFIAIGALFVAPAFVAIVAFGFWYIKFGQQRKFFRSIHDSHLMPLGFRPEIFNLDTRWQFSQEAYAVELADWVVILTQSNHDIMDVELHYFNAGDSKNPTLVKSSAIRKDAIRNMDVKDFKACLQRNAAAFDT